MGQFFGPPDLILKEIDRWQWQLWAPVMFRSDLAGEVIVPAGFLTDLSSIPRVLTIAYVWLHDQGRRASVLHDWLYGARDGRALAARARPTDPRRLADEVFIEALVALGVDAEARGAFWAGVRLGGAVAWWLDGRRLGD